MGDYSKKISKRIEHTRIKEGYCLICGVHGRLSKDHVPPKGSITIKPVEQRHITEFMTAKPPDLKGVKAQSGSIFKTICSHCNNKILGENDSEVARLNKDLTEKINTKFYRYDGTPSTLLVDLDAIKYCLAMIGHILSATTVEECKDPIEQNSYFTPLQKFVLGDDDAINTTHDIYYWFYPLERHISAKAVGIYNDGVHGTVSLLSFYPIAFLLADKAKDLAPPQARMLNLSDKQLILDLFVTNPSLLEYPFNKLEGNRFIALSEYQCITSYPQLNS